jgi:mono/diheme cytochrome c family protein
MTRLILAFLLLGQFLSCAVADDVSTRVERGKELANSLCAQCHAIGRTDRSPDAGAPAFRALAERFDLDAFIDRLRQGLTSGHPDMPTFRFTRDDARALIAYLRSIRSP